MGIYKKILCNYENKILYFHILKRSDNIFQYMNGCNSLCIIEYIVIL